MSMMLPEAAEEAEKEASHKSRIWLVVFLFLGVSIAYFGLKTTLAANININSGQKVEFGQGIAQATSCSGSQSIIVTPQASFTNSGGSTGNFKFSKFTFSNIPTSCYGYDFQINAYDSVSASSALALFNSTSTDAVIYDNNGTFVVGVGGTGMTVVTNSTSSFTATFTTPVAFATSVYKLAIGSENHTLLCNEGQNCSVGDTGPGGGIVFYVDNNGFTCGPTLNLTCKYLEASPVGWGNGANDWSLISAITAYQSTSAGVSAQGTAIGTGLRNCNAFVSQGNDATTLCGKARAYTGGGKNDWYIPSSDEITPLYAQRSIIGGYSVNTYATSTETASDQVSVKSFGPGNVASGTKSTTYVGRAIRAF